MPVSHAAIIGRSHRLMQQNSHDFAISGQPSTQTAFGLVLDGCGSKVNKSPAHNEVGAKSLGQFAAHWLRGELSIANGQLSIVNVPDNLHSACVGFLSNLTALYSFSDEIERTQFVAGHLLATIVGFVAIERTAVFFWQGDGYLVHNGSVTTLDSDNRPDYLAYRLLTGERNGRFSPPPPTL